MATANKSVQARILECAEAILRRRSYTCQGGYGGQGRFGWTVPQEELNHREHREIKGFFNSESLSSLCSLRLFFRAMRVKKYRRFDQAGSAEAFVGSTATGGEHVDNRLRHSIVQAEIRRIFT